MPRPTPSSSRRLAALAALAASVLAACGDDPRTDGRSAHSATASAPGAEDTLFAMQTGAFADSARAEAYRDSLAAEGWSASVRRANTARGLVWRVHVLHTRSRALADQAVAAARTTGGSFKDAVLSRVVVPGDARVARAEMWRVNNGSHGMAARVRWMLSPDRRSILVMEDPAAVEAEPVPNGVAYASEASGAVLVLDQVWDATPSPDWRRLALTWAFAIQGREAMTIARDRWIRWARLVPDSIARRVVDAPPGLARDTALADRLRADAFSVSGMAVAYGVGLVQRIRLDSLRGPLRLDAGAPAPGAVLRTDGWRVRWTPDGQLAVGAGLAGSQELAPPRRWVLVNETTGDSVGLVRDTTGLAAAPWTEGPTIDFQSVLNLPPNAPIVAGRRRIESRDGWIRVSEGGSPRVIGPGLPLAATATGRFIVALAPRTPEAEPHPAQLVLYRVDE